MEDMSTTTTHLKELYDQTKEPCGQVVYSENDLDTARMEGWSEGIDWVINVIKRGDIPEISPSKATKIKQALDYLGQDPDYEGNN